jgi:hypothetical protein
MTTAVPIAAMVSREDPDVASYPSADPDTPVITSVGLVTALGNDAQETWNALLAGKFITDHARIRFDAPEGQARILGLARRAVQEAAAPGYRGQMPSPDRTALVVATSKGPIEEWLYPLHIWPTRHM